MEKLVCRINWSGGSWAPEGTLGSGHEDDQLGNGIESTSLAVSSPAPTPVQAAAGTDMAAWATVNGGWVSQLRETGQCHSTC